MAKTITYITNNGDAVFTEYEYYLDVIETNLKCYKDDFFRNKNNFGSDAMDLTDINSIKNNINSIIKNRCNGKISLGSITKQGEKINITLNGSFGSSSGSINLSDNKIVNKYTK